MDPFDFWRDLRFACRSLAKQRSFSLMSVGILALGIAGVVTVFSMFNALYLRPFPVPNPDRLVDLDETAPKWGLQYTGLAYPDFHAWREHNQSFETMYAWAQEGANLSVEGKAERVKVLVVTHDYFDVLGIQPVLGKRFTEEEDRPGGPSVVLLSHGLWTRMSGRNPAVLGQTLQLDGAAFTIVGVLPPEAGFRVDIDLLRPLTADPQQGQTNWFLCGIGRLKRGVTGDVKHYGLEQPMRPSVYMPYGRAPAATMFAIVRTRGDPLALVPRVREILLSADADLPIHDVKTMSDRMRASLLFRWTYSSMFVVFGTIAALMAFAGICGVTSYWAGQRTQEIGIRMALGARATDVVRMVVRQGLRLVGLGLLLGLCAALGLSRLLTGMLYQVSPTDLTTFGATTCALTAAAAVACYLPARRAARIDPMVALRYE